MQPGDALVVLAEDDDSYAPLPDAAAAQLRASLLPPDAPCFLAQGVAAARPERVLFFGWRRDFPAIVSLLDRLVAPGSELHCACALPLAEREAQIADVLDVKQLANLKLVHHVANVEVRRGLEALPIDACTCVVIAADAGVEADVIQSDSQCLATLLLLRGIQASRRAAAREDGAAAAAAAAVAPEPPKALPPPPAPAAAKAASKQAAPAEACADPSDPDALGDPPLDADAEAPIESFSLAPPPPPGLSFGFSGDVLSSAATLPVVVEILDPRTQLTVTESHSMGLVSDFMHSNHLVSKILAMVAEDSSNKLILDQLLGGTGTQFAVVPAELYVAPDALVSFAELARFCGAAAACTLCGVVEPRGAAGAKLARAGDPRIPERVIINPRDKTARRTWAGCGLVTVTTDARLVAGKDAKR